MTHCRDKRFKALHIHTQAQNFDGDQENAPLPFIAIDNCLAAYTSVGPTSPSTKSTIRWQASWMGFPFGRMILCSFS